MTCLDDETVLGLIEGRLPPPHLATIEEHLDGCASCRDVVTLMARSTSSSALARGAQLGRYVIGDLVGEGAMGRVYSAWQPELDRTVAIKVLADGARDRLVAEAQAMAKLDHPNVVGVHEVGTTDDGVYVVMELVDGESLRSAMTLTDWRETTRLLVEVARGLAAVHAAGVIHRDVKPDNIIVGRDGRARLGDFGLARASRDEATGIVRPPSDTRFALGTASTVGSPLATIARGTAIAGTPVYMAPEVLRGGSATAASDQFGFGVTAYEALAGKRPFTGATWAELLEAVERDVAPLRTVPRWLDATVRRCLAIDPARRFASMAELAAHLEKLLQQRRRAPWIAGAVAAAAVASAATFVVSRDSSSESRGPSCEVVANAIDASWPASSPVRAALDAPAIRAVDAWTSSWRDHRMATCRAAQTEPSSKVAARESCLDRRQRELGALLAGIANAKAVVDGPTPAQRLVDALSTISPAECADAMPNAADPWPLDPDRARAARTVVDQLPAVRATIALGDPRPALPAIAALVETARTSEHAPTLAEALLVQADALRADSQLPAAALAARDALVAAERGHDDRLAAEAWLARVQLAADRRELALADELATIASGAIDRAGASKRRTALLLRTRGLLAYARGDSAAVRTLLGEARALLVAASGEQSLDVAGIETALGIAARTAGDLEAAERHHQRALEIDRALRGDRHPDIARDLHNLAGIARLRGELDVAQQRYEQALEIETALRGASSVQTGLTHNSLGLVKLARADLPGARRDFEQALAALSTAGHGDRAFPEHNLGLVAAMAGDHRTAIDHFTRAEATYVATIGTTTPGPIRLLLDRARSEAALGHATRARDFANRAITAARAAQLDWIAEGATTLLAATPATKPRPELRIAVEPATRDPKPIAQPAPADVPPPPKPTEPRPLPDVGVYGSSGGW